MARILVIDDDAAVGDTVRTMLLAGGHEVVLAGGVTDGIRQFGDERFDLIICDLFVPTKEQGLEAIVALRRISATTPIISMTGSVPMKDGKVLDRELLRIAEEFGAVQLIGKPFRMHDLLALVSRCLGSIAASAAALHTLLT